MKDHLPLYHVHYLKIHARIVFVVQILNALYWQTVTVNAHVYLVTLKVPTQFEVVLNLEIHVIQMFAVKTQYVIRHGTQCVIVPNPMLVIRSELVNNQLLCLNYVHQVLVDKMPIVMLSTDKNNASAGLVTLETHMLDVMNHQNRHVTQIFVVHELNVLFYLVDTQLANVPTVWEAIHRHRLVATDMSVGLTKSVAMIKPVLDFVAVIHVLARAQ